MQTHIRIFTSAEGQKGGWPPCAPRASIPEQSDTELRAPRQVPVPQDPLPQKSRDGLVAGCHALPATRRAPRLLRRF